ncbi:hypothetical protein CEXT_79851 [Caerostris extrusa]|uniref:Uncharacterized protein n=1 Tax=Caerostris extrusa TaxID=172846 RepID=A0AAV4QFQ8_CAEEX|nr:hypothetical protein CEXT_79851 [Caerostris extrusa]
MNAKNNIFWVTIWSNYQMFEKGKLQVVFCEYKTFHYNYYSIYSFFKNREGRNCHQRKSKPHLLTLHPEYANKNGNFIFLHLINWYASTRVRHQHESKPHVLTPQLEYAINTNRNLIFLHFN